MNANNKVDRCRLEDFGPGQGCKLASLTSSTHYFSIDYAFLLNTYRLIVVYSTCNFKLIYINLTHTQT